MAKIVPLISFGSPPGRWECCTCRAFGEGVARMPRQAGRRLSGHRQRLRHDDDHALGLNADAVKKFINDFETDILQFEAWVKKQPGVKLDKATVYKHNSRSRG